MTEAELVSKADLALADLLNNGGAMQPEQQQRFIRKIMGDSVILQQARRVNMTRSKLELNKISLASRVLRPGNQGAIVNPATSDGAGTRALARADRGSPTTEKVVLETKEVIAEIDLPYEAIEDAIEGGEIDGSQFEQTVLDLLAQRISLDLEELIVNGDTSSGDTYLALTDGLLKQSVSNIVDNGGDPMDPDTFGNALKALPVKYHKLLPRMQFYVSKTNEINYRMTVATRQTQLGDALLTGRAPVSVLGVPMTSAPQMPASNIILMDPSNLIIGVQRDLRIEYGKDMRQRTIFIVATMRLDIKFEEEDMVVKVTNVG